ncbi:MAG: cadherin-like domain-containing protein [Porticoccus sp.]|nr:cadherin-like domain-containing protein [Porticoccus sp.]MBQ0806932.1 cadherin-like domain-containing protein [Porticoccus sp.]
MATGINQYYDYALMMQAAYGLFDPNDLEGDAVEVALQDEDSANLTLSQAQEFVARFNTVDHFANDNTGFSATLFRDTENNNQAVLAIRGTEPSQFVGPDGAADLEIINSGIAFNQAISLYNYVNSLREGTQKQVALKSIDGLAGVPPQGIDVLYSSPQGQGVVSYYYIEEVAPIQGSGILADGEQIVVSGHSLGGHLAALASALFPDIVAEVYTYNAPGYDGLTQKVIHQITGSTAFSEFNDSIIHSLVGESEFGGDDYDPTSDLWTPFSSQESIFIEVNTNGDVGLAGHSKVQIADSLKLYDVFATMDSSLSSEEISGFLHLGSKTAANSLESITTALAEFFNIADSQIPQYVDADNLSARNKYHEVISAIKAEIGSSQYAIQAITGGYIANLAAQDTEAGRGYLYALVNLLPFSITGDLTGTAAADSKYDLNDTNGDRIYTDQYLADRSLMLQYILVRNAGDILNPSALESLIFDDKQSSLYFITKNIGGIDNFADRYIFGDDTNNIAGMDGGGGDDHLYGMGGNDILNGQAGNDYIEGGIGDDTITGGKGIDTLVGGAGGDIFQYISGDGNDRILDADTGGDRIVVNGVDLSTLIFNKLSDSADVYEAEGAGFRLVLSGVSALIQVPDSADTGSMTLTTFQSGDFGISLPGTSVIAPPEPPVTAAVIDSNYEIPDLDGDGVVETVYPEQDTVFNTRKAIVNNTPLMLDASILSDYLLASDGSPNTIFGFEGSYQNDQLQGGSLVDYLWGDEGDDVLYGLTGGDDLQGGKGSDFVFGGEGNDELWGDANTPTTGSPDRGVIDPYRGDTLDENIGDRDYLDGGAGDDKLSAGSYQDTLIGGTGNDFLAGGAGSDTLMGGDDDDRILGDSRLVQWIHYFDPDNGYVFRAPELIDQTKAGLTYDDLIDGGAGNDSLYGETGNDIINGGIGDDLILGDRVNNQDFYTWTIFTDPTVDPVAYESIGLGYRDLSITLHGNDVLYGDAGIDTILGNGGNDFISGGTGDDNLWGDDKWLGGQDHGDDTVYGGDGNDQLAGNGGSDVLYGEAGDDQLWGDDVAGIGVTPIGELYNGDDQLYGGAGLDQLVGGAGNDLLDGGTEDDQLFGEKGDDRLLGGDGSDYLTGDEGNDYLEGGAGNDTLHGGTGNDVLDGGAGADYLAGGAGDDTYIISGDAQVDTIEDTEGNNSLALSDKYSFSEVYLDQSASNRTGVYTSYHIETIDVNGEPVDTKVWDGGAFLLNDTFEQASTIVVGGQTHQMGDFVSFFATTYGGDFLGTSGDDNLSGGAFAVTFDGRGGNDVIMGSSANDVLDGGDGDDTIFGGDGSDQLYAGSGNNELTGGKGNDTLYGGSGNDTLYFNAGDGVDIWNATSGSTTDVDKLVIGPDLTDSDLVVKTNSSGDLILESKLDSSDKFIVSNYFPLVSAIPAANPVLEAIEFVDANGVVLSTWGLNDILSHAGQGSDGDDTIKGFTWNDELFGGLGNDNINGLSGDDTIWGEDGDDQLYGWHGNDYLSGGTGNDALYGGNDADILDGGSGDDTLAGGSGDDIYIRDRQGGRDTIQEQGSDHNIIQFGHGISESEVNVQFDNDGDLLVWLTGEDIAQHQLVVESYYSFRLSEFVFFDVGGNEVASWDAQTIMSQAYQNPSEYGVTYGSKDHDQINGGDGDDDIRSNNGDDVIDGGLGDDYIEAGSGNDDITGGEGNDRLRGEAGDNVYRYSLGDGSDVIFSDESSSNDLIYFDSSVVVGDVSFQRTNDSYSTQYYKSLTITYSGSDSIQIVDFSNLNSFQGVEFSDGTLISGAEISVLLNTPTAGDDVLLAGVSSVLGGLAGNDLLIGNSLDNIFEFGRGYDQDIVRDTNLSDVDVIKLVGGIGPNDVQLTRYQNDLIIEILDTNETLTVDRFYYGANNPLTYISQIEFSDAAATIWSNDYIVNLLSAPSENNDYLYLTSGDDVMDLLAGDDYVDGGSGNDILHGGSGNDDLNGGSDIDHLYGDAGDDRLSGGNHTDYHYWGVGGGHDIINSGSTSLFQYDSEGNRQPYDYLVIEGPGLTWSDIVLGQAGDDLVISFSGSVSGAENDSATIIDYFIDGDNQFKRIYLGSTSGASYTHVDVMTKFNNQTYASLVSEGDDVIAVADNGYGVEIHALGGNDSITGASGWDTLYGDTGGDSLFGGAGNDKLYGGDSDDVLSGDAGSDSLYGEVGNDQLNGGDGNDTLSGGDGNDLLNGGAGSDTLTGGDGSDTYIFGYGAGSDAINNFDESSGRYDVVSFDSSVSDSDVQVIRSGDNLILKLNEADQMTITNHFVSKGKNANDWVINEIQFSDGTSWDKDYIDTLVDQDLAGNYTLAGGAGDDLLEGYGGADILQGMAGSDTLYGGAGDDTLIGGAGDDFLSGGKGSDQYQYAAGDGNDTISNDYADATTTDSLIFDASVAVTTTSVQRIQDDLQIQLFSDESILLQSFFNTAYTVDKITFSDGTVWTPSDIDLMTTPNELPVAGTDNAAISEDNSINISFASLLANDSDPDGDSLSIVGFANALNGTVVADYVAESFTFTPNADFNGSASFEYELFDGKESSFGAVTVDVSAVNDAPDLMGDALMTAVDQSIIVPVSVLLANDLDVDGDTLQFVSAFGGYNGSVSYDDVSGMVTFIPGSGFEGDAGFDYQVTDGVDTVVASVVVDVQPANSGPVALPDNVATVDNTSVVVAEADLLSNDSDPEGDVLSITGVSNGVNGSVSWDQVNSTVIFTPSSDYVGPAAFSYTVSDGFEATTGNVSVDVSIDTSIARTTVGSSGAETLVGGRKGDRLFGLGGDDILTGAEGDDLLNGGEGNDLLVGDKGDDTYIFAAGSGQDTVDNSTSNKRDTDVLKFTGDITADMLLFSQSGDDLLIGLSGTTDSVMVQNWYTDEASQVEEVHTDDAVIYASDVDALVSAMASFSIPEDTASSVVAEFEEDNTQLLVASY